MLQRRARRCRTFSYVGSHRYSLTFCAYERRPLFVQRNMVECCVSQILRAADETHFEVTAYCVMPDHAHLVVKGADETSDLRDFVKRAKQLSGYEGKKACGRRVWQPGYYERILRPVESSRDAIRYVLENPVRAGLVQTPTEYAFSGSGVYTRTELWTYIFEQAQPSGLPRSNE